MARPLAVLVVAGAAVLAIFAAGCGRRSPAPGPRPVGIPLSPLGDDATPAALAPAPVPGVVPTWTMGPPDGSALVAPAPAPGGGGSIARAVGVIPAPTARPTQVVGAGGPALTDPEIVALMARVEPRRLSADVNSLVAFGTRHSLSTTDLLNRGIGAARDWLKRELDRVAGSAASQVTTELEDFPVTLAGRSTIQRNVIATLTGIGPVKRLIYVTAHYDSRAEDANDGTSLAPGADDNASGTAALLELARVLGNRQWDTSIRLVAFAAEEQDRQGSRYHAPLAQKAGLPIVAVLNNDIVGASRAADGTVVADRVRAFAAGPDDSPSRRLARYAQVVAARYGLPAVDVVAQADRPGHSGDHRSFSDAGFAAVRLIEAGEDPSRQHNARDTADRLDPAYHANAVRLNVAVVANLALAPPAPAAAPTLEAGGQPGTLRVQWAPVESPGVAGYYVAWRPTGETAYRQVVWAGPGTSMDLGGLPDGAVAVAVAASDDRGHIGLFGPEAGR